MAEMDFLELQAMKAANVLESGFADVHITDVNVLGDRVRFYNGENLLFDYSKEEVLNEDF